MKFTSTIIPDVILVEPRVYSDERGFFLEAYHFHKYTEAGITAQFVQDNHSGSRQGTLRGLHYQIRHSQGKLVRVIAGEVFDVAVDLRKKSPSFGKWVGQKLTAENYHQLWIPPGFAHGFYVLSEWAEILYKTTTLYAPEWERTLLWNDSDLGIEWPLLSGVPLIMSPKDLQGTPFSSAEVFV